MSLLQLQPNCGVCGHDRRLWHCRQPTLSVVIAVTKKQDSNAYMVLFLVDAAAPSTYVNKDVLQRLDHVEALPECTLLFINGFKVEANLAVGRSIEGINILGTDVLSRCQDLTVDYKSRTVTLR